MRIRTRLILGVFAALLSIGTGVQAQQDSSLPSKGLPGKSPLVVRLDLEKLEAKNLTATLDSIAKIFPEEETEAHEAITLMRDDIFPALGDIRGILREAGVQQALLIGEMSNQTQDDAQDDKDPDDGVFLLKVGPDATPAGVRAAMVKSFDRGIKAAEALAKMEEKTGSKSEADETREEIEDAREDMKELDLTQWDDGWLLVTGPKQVDMKTAEPNKKGLANLQAALKRSGGSPISFAYNITDEDRAKIVAGAQGNPMFGQIAAAASNMKWVSSWMELGNDPQFKLAMNFGTQQDAAQFKTQMTQMLNFLQMMMTMNQGQNQKAGQVAMALVADLIPTQENQELLVTLTKSTVEKMYEMSKVMEEMNQGGPGGGPAGPGGPGQGGQPGPGEDF